MPEGSKVCAKCNKAKPYSAFRRHKGHGDGWDSRCKMCMRTDSRLEKAVEDASLVDVPVKTGFNLEARYRAMVEPYRKWEDHERRCQGCDRHEAILEKAIDGYQAFFEAFSGKQLPGHARIWVREALANTLLLLNVPPRHAKTTLMAIWFVIWQFACNRDTQVIVVSKTIALGEKISRKVSNELETNVALIKAFGRFRPEDLSRPWRVAKGELEIEGKDLALRSGDLSLQIRGSGQQILGMEADWVVADDITDRRVAKSESDRETEWDFFLGDVLTRLAPHGKAFCIGQRVHSEDIYGRLGQMQDDDGVHPWTLIRTPAITDEYTGEVLWPELWDYDKLVAKRKSIGSALFQCMYQQAPEYAGEFVPRLWLEGDVDDPSHPGCYDFDRSVGQGWKPVQGEYLPMVRVVSIDPSPTKFAAIVVADILWLPRQQEFYAAIVDVHRDRMGMREMMSQLDRLARRYRPSVLVFETNSAKWFKEDPAYNRLEPMFAKVIGQNTHKYNKGDTELGIWSLAADFEAGRIRFPMQDPADRQVMDVPIGEILAYPNGTTDDTLMALWFIKCNYKLLAPREHLASHFNRSLATPRSWTREALPSNWRPLDA